MQNLSDIFLPHQIILATFKLLSWYMLTPIFFFFLQMSIHLSCYHFQFQKKKNYGFQEKKNQNPSKSSF